jgi:hypothetical protein
MENVTNIIMFNLFRKIEKMESLLAKTNEIMQEIKNMTNVEKTLKLSEIFTTTTTMEYEVDKETGKLVKNLDSFSQGKQNDVTILDGFKGE